jgi:hypothetical protein
MLSKVNIHKDKVGNKNICKTKAPYKKVSNKKQDNTDSFTSSDTDDTSAKEYNMIIVNESTLNINTQKYNIYKQVINYILMTFGTGFWVKRSEAIKPVKIDINITRGYFTKIYQESNECNNEKQLGVLMKKYDNEIYIRLN